MDLNLRLIAALREPFVSEKPSWCTKVNPLGGSEQIRNQLASAPGMRNRRSKHAACNLDLPRF